MDFPAVTNPTPDAPLPGYGWANKKPMLAGACLHCPIGSMAQWVKRSMVGTAWDVQVCASCAGPKGPTLVADRKKGAPFTPPNDYRAVIYPPWPDAPMDLGISVPQWLRWTYEGSNGFNGGTPRHNLRVIASIQSPKYLMVAVRKDSGITDLS